MWLRWVDGLPPPACRLCGQTGSGRLCGPCLEALPWNRPACAACAAPLAVPQPVCAGCRRRPPVFGAAFSLFRLEPPVQQWIYGIKSRADFVGIELLSDLMTRYCPLPGAALLLPVPLHRRRLRRRGYNQAWELARRVAHRRGLPCSATALTQVRETPDLTQLDRAARRTAVRGAFCAKAEQVVGQDIVLIDDVLTTGATAEAAARACLRAGAVSVSIWTAARTA